MNAPIGPPTAVAKEEALLNLRALSVDFDLGRNRPPLRAVDDVTFGIGARETVGLVGESGSGKSTIGRAVLGLAPITEGEVSFGGVDITHASRAQRRALSAQLQVVFQDPYSSLNPARTVGSTLAEMTRARPRAERGDVKERIRWLLERVGLPANAALRYPAEFSGGQRQRIAIARALMNQPRLIICDEVVSALDLSAQAQVLNLLTDLQNEFGLAYLFISHDLAVVHHVSHRIVVVYRGRVMEEGDASKVYRDPVHPYTRALLDAVPRPDPDVQRGRRATSSLRPVSDDPPGANACPYASRCPHAVDLCRVSRPQPELTSDGRVVACHRWTELALEPKGGQTRGVAC